MPNQDLLNKETESYLAEIEARGSDKFKAKCDFQSGWNTCASRYDKVLDKVQVNLEQLETTVIALGYQGKLNMPEVIKEALASIKEFRGN